MTDMREKVAKEEGEWMALGDIVTMSENVRQLVSLRCGTTELKLNASILR